jgi:serine/threonine protein kinase
MTLSRFVMDLRRFCKSRLLYNKEFISHYEGIDTSTNEKVDLFSLTFHEWSPLIQRFLFHELETLAGNTHPATLRLVGFSLNLSPETPIEIATELHPNGLLGDILKREWKEGPILNATQRSKIIFGIVAGMASLHGRNVLHRDLKPGNILLNAQFEPVIAGFSLSVSYDANLPLNDILGTQAFMAPEMLEGEESYAFPIDVYSFAVTLYSIFAELGEMDDGRDLTGKSTFHFVRAICSGVRFVKKEGIPDSLWEVIQSCWKEDPKVRPTFQQLLESFRGGHRYVLEGGDLSAVLEYEQTVDGEFGVPNIDGTAASMEILESSLR